MVENTVYETLRELLQHPEGAKDLPLEVIPALIGKLEEVRATLTLRINASHSNGLSLANEDRLLGAGEAAEKLGISRDSLYRHDWAFKLHLGSRVRFSEQGIESFIRARSGR